jgi:hypothetical protein
VSITFNSTIKNPSPSCCKQNSPSYPNITAALNHHHTKIDKIHQPIKTQQLLYCQSIHLITMANSFSAPIHFINSLITQIKQPANRTNPTLPAIHISQPPLSNHHHLGFSQFQNKTQTKAEHHQSIPICSSSPP